MRLKTRQVAAQSLSGARVDPRPLRQQVAADGQYLVTKLLGGGPPSPTDGPKPRRGRSMTRLHPPLGESSVRTMWGAETDNPRSLAVCDWPIAPDAPPAAIGGRRERSQCVSQMRLGVPVWSPAVFLHAQLVFNYRIRHSSLVNVMLVPALSRIWPKGIHRTAHRGSLRVCTHRLSHTEDSARGRTPRHTQQTYCK